MRKPEALRRSTPASMTATGVSTTTTGVLFMKAEMTRVLPISAASPRVADRPPRSVT